MHSDSIVIRVNYVFSILNKVRCIRLCLFYLLLIPLKIQTVKNVQDALRRSLNQLDQARSEDESKFHSRQVTDLKAKNDEMMLILKVIIFHNYNYNVCNLCIYSNY